ncbi:MAG: hypothetical protein K0Q51_1400 [Rickettsiaceae bacterium]|jgi:hypothetical protein|nr:hypothetical protein [Rickettsiaceae bacterium]
MTAYSRIVLQELNKDKVVNKRLEEGDANKVSLQMVKDALEHGLQEHTIDSSEQAAEEASSELSIDEVQVTSEEEEKNNTESVQPTIIDLEAIKAQSYSEGFQKAKEELEQQILKIRNEVNFQNNLGSELSKLNIDYEIYESQLCNSALKIILIILEKLAKKLPTDFEMIISEQIKKVIRNSRIEAELIVKYNSKQQAVIEEILKNLALSEESKKHIRLENDDNLTTESCQICYREAALEYKEEKIIEEVDNIISAIKF